MKPIVIIGIVLIVVGVAALFLGHFSFSQTTPVLDAGPIHVRSTQTHTVWVPTLAGIIAVVAGLGLVFSAKRS